MFSNYHNLFFSFSYSSDYSPIICVCFAAILWKPSHSASSPLLFLSLPSRNSLSTVQYFSHFVIHTSDLSCSLLPTAKTVQEDDCGVTEQDILHVSQTSRLSGVSDFKPKSGKAWLVIKNLPGRLSFEFCQSSVYFHSCQGVCMSAALWRCHLRHYSVK